MSVSVNRKNKIQNRRTDPSSPSKGAAVPMLPRPPVVLPVSRPRRCLRLARTKAVSCASPVLPPALLLLGKREGREREGRRKTLTYGNCPLGAIWVRGEPYKSSTSENIFIEADKNTLSRPTQKIDEFPRRLFLCVVFVIRLTNTDENNRLS